MNQPSGSDCELKSIERLARSACEGNRFAFDEVLRYFYPRLKRFLEKRLHGSRVDPEDVLQETMVKAWRFRGQFDAQYRFSAWLYTIAIRTSKDHLRRKRPADGDEMLEDYPSSDQSPVDATVSNETVSNLWHLAHVHLTPDQYTALWLRYAEELSVTEVAHAMSKSSVATRVLLYRARAALAPRLNRKFVPADRSEVNEK